MRLIDANDLISDMKDNCCGECDLCIYSRYEGDINVRYFCGLIEEAETVERPHGKWIEGKNGTIMCSKCGCEIRFSYLVGNKPDFPKFCCDCGAEMKEE